MICISPVLVLLTSFILQSLLVYNYTDLADFISNVANNRGMILSIFNNEDDAKEWLFSK